MFEWGRFCEVQYGQYIGECVISKFFIVMYYL